MGDWIQVRTNNKRTLMVRASSIDSVMEEHFEYSDGTKATYIELNIKGKTYFVWDDFWEVFEKISKAELQKQSVLYDKAKPEDQVKGA